MYKTIAKLTNVYYSVSTNIFSVNKYIFRNNHTKQYFTVNPFCKIKINSSFPIQLKPSDEHNHSDDDNIIITTSDNNGILLNCVNNENEFIISGETVKRLDPLLKQVPCVIEGPIKADLDINMKGKSDIIVGQFGGTDVNITTDKGKITLEGLESEHIHLSSHSGDITCNGTMRARTIKVQTVEKGNIKIKKIQGIDLHLSSDKGDVEINSCYSKTANFKSTNGDFKLNNVHADCSIEAENIGTLLMTGFDGTLHTEIENCDGNIDVQLSRLHDNSKININQSNKVNIRLGEDIQKNNNIVILAKSIVNPDGIKINEEIDDKNITLNVNCKKSNVNLSSASWSQMITFI